MDSDSTPKETLFQKAQRAVDMLYRHARTRFNAVVDSRSTDACEFGNPVLTEHEDEIKGVFAGLDDSNWDDYLKIVKKDFFEKVAKELCWPYDRAVMRCAETPISLNRLRFKEFGSRF